MLYITELQVKVLNKRASGHAFEVILSPSTPDAKGEFPLSPLKKKGTSLDEIKKKLEAAEERRKVLTRHHWTLPNKRKLPLKNVHKSVRTFL